MLTTAQLPTQKQSLRDVILHTILRQLAKQSKEREMRDDERTFAADTAQILASSNIVKVYGSLDIGAIADELMEKLTLVQVQREEIFSRFLQATGHA